MTPQNQIMEEQFIHFGKDGVTRYFADKAMKICHRLDGPAIEWSNGSKLWFVNGKRHRLDGPAVEWSDGSKSWWVDDKLHRLDGPAVEYPSGRNAWYVDGKYLTEEAFIALSHGQNK
jgi:hypothetical protein